MKQPHNSMTVSRQGETELLWNLTFDGLPRPYVIKTTIEDGLQGGFWYLNYQLLFTLRYDAFFFLNNSSNQLYFVWEATNHEFHRGKIVDLTKDPAEERDWEVNNGLVIEWVS